MWPFRRTRYGLWFFLYFGIQNQLVRSDAVNYEDADANEDKSFADFRRANNEGYGSPRSNQPQCPSVGLCELMAAPLKAFRTALAELESNSAAYCSSQPSLARFQPMNFPPFPSMDLMQFPPFPPFMSPPNAPLANPPPNPAPVVNPAPPNYPPANYAPPIDQQRPNPPQQGPNKSPPAGSPWDIFTDAGTQPHKKIKVKICNSRRSGSGKKKHAAAAAPIQKPPREGRERATTTETAVAGRRGEDEFRSATPTAADMLSTTISYLQEPVGNDANDKKEKVD